MTTLLVSHPASLDHLTPPGHPERPDRMRAVAQVLGESRFDALVREEAPEGSLDLVTLCHDERYVEELRHIAPDKGLIYLDGDTSMSPGTWEAVMRGVGGAVAATEAVMSGKADNAFVAMRPPGHHAEINRPMGFCFFDHAAIAARHAQRKYGIARAAVVDFDVHHGNGTQDIFYDDPEVLFHSIHRYGRGFYPGTGAAEETGKGKGQGYTVNVPVRFGTSRKDYRDAFTTTLEKAADKIKPELVLVSAGFDAHARDPIGSLGLETEDFTTLTKLVLDVARVHAKGRLVSCLEGGYHLDALAESVQTHLEELLAFKP